MATPARPSETATMLANVSWPFVAWTSGSATGSRKSSTGVQYGAYWRKPAMADSTVSTPTTSTIDRGPSFPPCG